jgi:hypothetical protein
MTTRAYGGAINGATKAPQATLVTRSRIQRSRLYDRQTIDKHLDMKGVPFALTWAIDAVFLVATAVAVLLPGLARISS